MCNYGMWMVRGSNTPSWRGSQLPPSWRHSALPTQHFRKRHLNAFKKNSCSCFEIHIHSRLRSSVASDRSFAVCVDTPSHMAESVNKEKCHVRKKRLEVGLHGIQLSRAGFAYFLSGRGTDLAETKLFGFSCLADTTALFSIITAIDIVRHDVCHCRGCVRFLGTLHHFPTFSSSRQVGTKTHCKDLIGLSKRCQILRVHIRGCTSLFVRQQSGSVSLLRLPDKLQLPI